MQMAIFIIVKNRKIAYFNCGNLQGNKHKHTVAMWYSLVDV